MAYGQGRVESRVERERERERQCTIEHTHAKVGLRLRLCMGCAILNYDYHLFSCPNYPF